MLQRHLLIADYEKYLDTADISEEYLQWLEPVSLHLQECEKCRGTLNRIMNIDFLCEEGLGAALDLVDKEAQIRRVLFAEKIREQWLIKQLADTIRMKQVIDSIMSNKIQRFRNNITDIKKHSFQPPKEINIPSFLDNRQVHRERQPYQRQSHEQHSYGERKPYSEQKQYGEQLPNIQHKYLVHDNIGQYQSQFSQSQQNTVSPKLVQTQSQALYNNQNSSDFSANKAGLEYPHPSNRLMLEMLYDDDAKELCVVIASPSDIKSAVVIVQDCAGDVMLENAELDNTLGKYAARFKIDDNDKNFDVYVDIK